MASQNNAPQIDESVSKRKKDDVVAKDGKQTYRLTFCN